MLSTRCTFNSRDRAQSYRVENVDGQLCLTCEKYSFDLPVEIEVSLGRCYHPRIRCNFSIHNGKQHSTSNKLAFSTTRTDPLILALAKRFSVAISTLFKKRRICKISVVYSRVLLFER